MVYFDDELKTTSVFAAFGVLIGYLSFVLNNSLLAVGLMLVGLAVLTVLMQKSHAEKHPIRWFVGNGIVVYIFLWLIVWTIFYNIVVI